MGSRVFHLEEVLPRVGELNQGEKIELLEFRLGDGLESVYFDAICGRCPCSCQLHLLISCLLVLVHCTWRHLRVESYSMGWLSGAMSRVVGSFLQTILPPKNSPLGTELPSSRLRPP